LISALKNFINKGTFFAPEKRVDSVGGYDLWAQNYDLQPGNLMLDMDEAIFSELFNEIDAKSKNIADIGCGTGRHWTKILLKQPAKLTGFDVSLGMLNRLKEKFPDADAHHINNNLLSEIPDSSVDIIISTLTIAHIEDVNEALHAWCRILKQTGDIIITDFHPNALAFGAKRTFNHHKTSISIQNYVHYVSEIQDILFQHHFRIVNKIEERINESVKHYYAAKNALHVYEKFKDMPIIYGIHLKRCDDIA
jgi:ubiquinone/menaquinone biosynthesis C-methylase UbiE